MRGGKENASQSQPTVPDEGSKAAETSHGNFVAIIDSIYKKK